MRHATSINSYTVFFALENSAFFMKKILKEDFPVQLCYFTLKGSWFLELSVKYLKIWKLWSWTISFLTYKVLQITVGNCLASLYSSCPLFYFSPGNNPFPACANIPNASHVRQALGRMWKWVIHSVPKLKWPTAKERKIITCSNFNFCGSTCLLIGTTFFCHCETKPKRGKNAYSRTSVKPGKSQVPAVTGEDSGVSLSQSWCLVLRKATFPKHW